jgi:hypothetical protein
MNCGHPGGQAQIFRLRLPLVPTPAAFDGAVSLFERGWPFLSFVIENPAIPGGLSASPC